MRRALTLSLLLLCLPSPGRAEEGRIITANVFPWKAPRQKPAQQKADQQKPAQQKPNQQKAPRQKAAPAKNQREAQLRSMTDLFCRYNPKLTRQQARNFADLVIQAGNKYRQEPFVLAAMIVRESGARPGVISKGGDYGLMQVRWRVHQDRIKREYPQVRTAKDFLDPKVNIMVGTEIFAECRAALPPEKRANVRNGLLRYSAGNAKMADRVMATVKALEQAYQKHLKALP